MGWWNQTIYGGDESLKWQEEIYNCCNYELYGKNNKIQAIPVDVLSEKINDIIYHIENTSESENSESIGFQIIGAILMHSGYDINSFEGLKEKIIASTEDDEYAKDNAVRRNVMKNFKKLVEDYDFNNPVAVHEISITNEPEESDEEIKKEFKIILDLIKARKKKLEKGKTEKSGNDDYDEGYADASQEEIEFLTDFSELMSKMEMMGVLMEKISENISSSNSTVYSSKEKLSSAPTPSQNLGSGKDIMPG